jgi:type IV secretory pathway VirB2 component (pilin)
MRHELVKLLKQRKMFRPSVSLRALKESADEDDDERANGKMLTRMKRILNGNLAFLPVLVLLAVLGFRCDAGKGNKIFRLLYSLTMLIVVLVSSAVIRFSTSESVVVGTIDYINARCMHYTLIIIHIRNVLSRKSLRSAFKCFDNIDRSLQTSFDVRIKDDESKWFVRSMLLLLAFSAFSGPAFDLYNGEAFNVGQFAHAVLVFVLSVKILLYCMLCAGIKRRFIALIQHLRAGKSSQSSTVAVGGLQTTTEAWKTVVGATPVGSVSQLKEISLMFDEVLDVISLMNEAFSTLLSTGFGELWEGKRE